MSRQECSHTKFFATPEFASLQQAWEQNSNPNSDGIAELSVDMILGEQAKNEARHAWAMHTFRLFLETQEIPTDHGESALKVFQFGILIGVFLSEMGRAKFILREGK